MGWNDDGSHGNHSQNSDGSGRGGKGHGNDNDNGRDNDDRSPGLGEMPDNIADLSHQRNTDDGRGTGGR